MLRFRAFPFRCRAWRLGSVALVLVFIISGCCPPALRKRSVEKNDPPTAAEKKNP